MQVVVQISEIRQRIEDKARQIAAWKQAQLTPRSHDFPEQSESRTCHDRATRSHERQAHIQHEYAALCGYKNEGDGCRSAVQARTHSRERVDARRVQAVGHGCDARSAQALVNQDVVSLVGDNGIGDGAIRDSIHFCKEVCVRVSQRLSCVDPELTSMLGFINYLCLTHHSYKRIYVCMDA
jgi:hypothetical protein